MDKLKCAVIGLGRISGMHLDATEQSDDARLVAVCDVKSDIRNEISEKYKVRAYSDYKKLIDTEKPDVVHICLPHYLHIPVSRYAMEAGANVICEKPMSVNYEDALGAVKLAKEKNVLYGIIFQCRFNEASVLVKNAVESGKLGKIISASSYLTWARPDEYYSDSDWKGTWDKEGGGVLIDQAIHSIDLVNWLIDDAVSEIKCSMFNRNHKTISVEDTAEGLIKYGNGVTYSFYCMNNFPIDEPIRIELVCENGKAVFNYDEAEISYNDGTSEHVNAANHTTVKGSKDYWGSKHFAQIQQFYNACLGKEPLAVSGEDALKTQKLICDIYEKGKKYISL